MHFSNTGLANKTWSKALYLGVWFRLNEDRNSGAESLRKQKNVQPCSKERPQRLAVLLVCVEVRHLDGHHVALNHPVSVVVEVPGRQQREYSGLQLAYIEGPMKTSQ